MEENSSVEEEEDEVEFLEEIVRTKGVPGYGLPKSETEEGDQQLGEIVTMEMEAQAVFGGTNANAQQIKSEQDNGKILRNRDTADRANGKIRGMRGQGKIIKTEEGV